MQDLVPTSQLAAPALDLEHLRRATFGDRAFRDEVLTLFVHESKILLERLAAAQSDQDWRMAAHSLKGMARGVGAFRLAEASAEIELLAGGLRLERRREVLASLGRPAADAMAEAERLMGEAI